MKPTFYALIITAVAGLTGATLSLGLPQETKASAGHGTMDVEESGYLLAMFLDAGRVVVDRNQPLINDRHLGVKGFTPEAFEAQVVEEMRVRTGVDLRRLDEARVPSLARALLPMLMQASKEVVASAQIVINQRGIGYKNFIPASFARLAAARFSVRAPVRLKQVALQPRNPKNTPDSYEAAVLSHLMTIPGRAEPHTEIIDADVTGKTFRMLVPLYYEKHCLECHGTPAGLLDISGYPKEGAHEGDMAGAISVSIPLSVSLPAAATPHESK